MASRPYSPRAGRLAALSTVVPLICGLFCLWAGAALAAGQDNAPDTAKAKLASSGSPVVITARTLVADNKKKEATYKKDVVVKKDDMTLYADMVVVQLDKSGKAQGPSQAEGVMKGAGKLDTIVATGRVKIVQQDKTATSDKATYFNASDTVVMTGNPKVWQGDNVLTGSKITYNVKDDTFEVEEAKTVLYPKKDGQAKPGKAEDAGGK